MQSQKRALLLSTVSEEFTRRISSTYCSILLRGRCPRISETIGSPALAARRCEASEYFKTRECLLPEGRPAAFRANCNMRKNWDRKGRRLSNLTAPGRRLLWFAGRADKRSRASTNRASGVSERPWALPAVLRGSGTSWRGGLQIRLGDVVR